MCYINRLKQRVLPVNIDTLLLLLKRRQRDTAPFLEDCHNNGALICRFLLRLVRKSA